MIRRLFWLATAAGVVLAWKYRERIAEIFAGRLEPQENLVEDDEDETAWGLRPVMDPATVEPVYAVHIEADQNRMAVVETLGDVIDRNPEFELHEDGSALVVAGLSYFEAQELATEIRGRGADVSVRPLAPRIG